MDALLQEQIRFEERGEPVKLTDDHISRIMFDLFLGECATEYYFRGTKSRKISL